MPATGHNPNMAPESSSVIGHTDCSGTKLCLNHHHGCGECGEEPIAREQARNRGLEGGWDLGHQCTTLGKPPQERGIIRRVGSFDASGHHGNTDSAGVNRPSVNIGGDSAGAPSDKSQSVTKGHVR